MNPKKEAELGQSSLAITDDILIENVFAFGFFFCVKTEEKNKNTLHTLFKSNARYRSFFTFPSRRL